MKTYQEETNNLLEFIISKNFYDNWKKPFEEQQYIFGKKREIVLEFNITAACNQKCEYCYLVKYGDKLYPPEIRDKNKILNNLETVLKYYLKQNFNIGRIDLFSGEIWGSEFGNEIFEILLKYIEKGLSVQTIVIPSNHSFLINKKITSIIQSYIMRFQQVHTRLTFSASVDGKYLENEVRPFKNKEITAELKTDIFYDELAKFAKRNEYGFHPMVSTYGIEKWPENYKWWCSWYKENFKHIYEKEPLDWLKRSMFLEVRNDGWTDEKIISYLKFLKTYAEENLLFWEKHGEINNFTKDQILTDFYSYYFIDAKEGYENKLMEKRDKTLIRGYTPLGLYSMGGIPGCSISNSLVIRLGDLAICPCHRTSYDKFIYGRYEVQDNGDLKIIGENPLLAFKILGQTHKTNPKCGVCKVYPYCGKGCYGSQYETEGELFYPIDSVCELYYAKFIFTYLYAKWFFDEHNLKKYIRFFGTERESDVVFKKILQEEKGIKWYRIIKQEFQI